MDNQDWKPIIFKKENKKVVTSKTSNMVSHKVQNEDYKLENKKLGQLILQARNAKNLTQDILANQLGTNKNIIKRWESNIELPSNANIAKIEKLTGVSLPRNKKKKIEE